MPTPPDFTNGTALEASSLNAVGLWLVKTQTVGTTVSSVTVSNAFSADFVDYRIVYTGGTASTDGNFTFAFNGNPTGWNGNIIFANFAGGTPASIGNSNSTTAGYIGAAASGFPQVVADLQNPFLAQPSLISASYVDGGNAGRSTYHHSSSASYTGFTLTKAAGTISGGIIKVYGYRK
jgi:hypothetical protein